MQCPDLLQLLPLVHSHGDADAGAGNDRGGGCGRAERLAVGIAVGADDFSNQHCPTRWNARDSRGSRN